MSDAWPQPGDEERESATHAGIDRGDTLCADTRRPRCKRRYRVPGTGGSTGWQRCPGTIDTAHTCSVCGMPPRDYRNEGTR